MVFHWQGGWFFERIENGSVHIFHEYITESKEIKRDFNLEIDADSWCSIIASVGKLGETAETWKEANKFHKGI